MVEPRASLGAGVAYSTPEPAHRINVPAARMQLSGEEQGAFDRWYRQQPECSLDSAAHCADGAVYPQRALFGRYRCSSLPPPLRRIRMSLCVTFRRVLAWEGQQLLLSNGETLTGDILALAISHPPPSPAHATAVCRPSGADC